MKLFRKLFGSKPRYSEPAYSDNDIQVIAGCAERCIEVMNESLQIAANSNNPNTKISRLSVAKQKLDEIKGYVNKYPFLSLTFLNEVESDILRLEKEFLLAGYKEIDPELLKLTIHQFADQSSVVMKGYRFSATLQPTVPLKHLRRHGELLPNIPDEEKKLDSPHFIWLPEIESEYSFLSEGGTVSSSIGPIDPDGGNFLPFLIALREILERPRDLKITDYADALVRKNEISELSDSEGLNAGDYLQKLFGDSQNQLLEFILQEFRVPSHKGLKIDHLKQLSDIGYSSLSEMLEAPDDVLLSLKGIGSSKLKTIRENNKMVEPVN